MLADAKPLPVGWHLICTLLDCLLASETHQTCNAATGPSECHLCMPTAELCFGRVECTFCNTVQPRHVYPLYAVAC